MLLAKTIRLFSWTAFLWAAGIIVWDGVRSYVPSWSKLAALLLALAPLTGCVDTLARIGQIEKAVVEPNVDAIVDEAVNRLCNLPPDVVGRAMQRRGDAVLLAIDDLCPAYRALFAARDRLNRQIIRPLSVPLPLGAPPAEEPLVPPTVFRPQPAPFRGPGV